MTQGERPEWGPLLALVGDEVLADFMWMFEVELSDGALLQAYKHIDTRCYLHLGADGSAWTYGSPGRYAQVSAADLLAAVFFDLPALGGVTDDQIAASRAAVERAERRQRAGARLGDG